MIATINSDCTEITINSSHFNLSNLEVELTLKHNDTTTYEVALPASNTDAVVVDASTLDVEALPQGIYYIKLKITKSDSSVVEESLCKALICSLICDSLMLYADEANLMKVLALEALIAADSCIDCSCATMLKLYKIVTDDDDSSDCGCT